MAERESRIVISTCSKCGKPLYFGDARNRLGNLFDHRLCPVPKPTVSEAERG